MAGTCDVVTPAMSLATALPFRFAAIAVGRAPASDHHLRVLLLCRAGHQRGQILKRQAVGGAELRGVIDVAAELQHPIPVALQDRMPLLRRHRELIEILLLIRLEGLAVRILHQRHAEHVEPIPLARALRIEDLRARYVLIGFWRLYLSHLTSPNRAASDCRRAAPFAARRWARSWGSCRPARRHRAYASSCWDAANPFPTARDP